MCVWVGVSVSVCGCVSVSVCLCVWGGGCLECFCWIEEKDLMFKSLFLLWGGFISTCKVQLTRSNYKTINLSNPELWTEQTQWGGSDIVTVGGSYQLTMYV